MVQINLPENSKIKKGKYYKDQTGSKNIRKVNIYRWDPSTGENPRIDTYDVDGYPEYYCEYGYKIIDILKENIKPLNKKFSVIQIS